MRLSLLLILFCLFLPLNAQIQKLDSVFRVPRYLFLNTKYNLGWVLNTNDFVNGVNSHNKVIKAYQAMSFGFGKQTYGSRDWEHVHNFPSFGVAFYTAKFWRGSELGYPNALYGFYNAPFYRWNRSALMFQIDFGRTYNWKPYDAEDNPFNVAIGSSKTVYVGFGIEYNYYLTPHWLLALGYDVTHFSNGAARKPNKGLNLAAPQVTLQYSFKELPRFQRRYDIKHQDYSELYFALGYGKKQADFDTLLYTGLKNKYPGLSYNALTLSTGVMCQYSHKSKAGIGFDILYDEFLGSSLYVNGEGVAEKVLSLDTGDRFSLGMFVSHEFCISRLSIVTQLGAYVLQQDVKGKKPSTYARAGLKYHLGNDVFLGINIFAHHFSKADFIEWNVGYRLRRLRVGNPD